MNDKFLKFEKGESYKVRMLKNGKMGDIFWISKEKWEEYRGESIKLAQSEYAEFVCSQ